MITSWVMATCCHHGCLVVGEQHTFAVMVSCKETVVKWLTMKLLYDLQHVKMFSHFLMMFWGKMFCEVISFVVFFSFSQYVFSCC